MKDWELSRMCVCVCVCERERVRESNVNDECLFVTAKGKKISNVKKGAVDFFSIRPVRQKIRRNRERKTDTHTHTERERERELLTRRKFKEKASRQRWFHVHVRCFVGTQPGYRNHTHRRSGSGRHAISKREQIKIGEKNDDQS